MEAKLEKYNVDQLGEIPIEREDGTMRIMVCQMGGCAGKEVREMRDTNLQKSRLSTWGCLRLQRVQEITGH